MWIVNYEFPFFHPSKYWETPGNCEREIFANIFSLEAIGDTEKLAFLDRNFPDLMEAYRNLDFSV